MDGDRLDRRTLLRLLLLAPANVRLVFVAGALCEAFLVILSFAIRRTAADDPGLQPTVTALIKTLLYIEVVVGIAVVMGIFALITLRLLRHGDPP